MVPGLSGGVDIAGMFVEVKTENKIVEPLINAN